jgi:hypothetical protein
MERWKDKQRRMQDSPHRRSVRTVSRKTSFKTNLGIFHARKVFQLEMIDNFAKYDIKCPKISYS